MKIPAPYNIGGAKDGVEDLDSFISVQRGMTLIGAAYTDIPDYEAKLEQAKGRSCSNPYRHEVDLV